VRGRGQGPSDYFTRVIDGAFYGWPYTYGGGHVDQRVAARSDVGAKTKSPDVPLGAHVATLQFAFYEGTTEHGSWNRGVRSGYDVVFVPFTGGSPSGRPTPFLSGFVPNPSGKQVYGRPVGVAVAKDGSLLVSDDGARVICAHHL
jgi:glucose/arabinose dehydrogenase